MLKKLTTIVIVLSLTSYVWASFTPSWAWCNGFKAQANTQMQNANNALSDAHDDADDYVDGTSEFAIAFAAVIAAKKDVIYWTRLHSSLSFVCQDVDTDETDDLNSEINFYHDLHTTAVLINSYWDYSVQDMTGEWIDYSIQKAPIYAEIRDTLSAIKNGQF